MRKQGFTLIEMMAIIIILAVIALFSFPSILELIDNNEIKNNEEQLSNLYMATENYIVQNYKDDIPVYITVEELILNDYVRMDSKITAYKEDDLIKVNKDDNGVWIYTLKPNLFDISMVKSNDNVVNNGDGTLTINKSTSTASVPNKLKDYAPQLEAGKKYRLSATTTGTSKFICLSGAERGLAFEKNYKYSDEVTIEQKHLDSAVVWYIGGSDTSATISDIRIIEMD